MAIKRTITSTSQVQLYNFIELPSKYLCSILSQPPSNLQPTMLINHTYIANAVLAR